MSTRMLFVAYVFSLIWTLIAVNLTHSNTWSAAYFVLEIPGLVAAAVLGWRLG